MAWAGVHECSGYSWGASFHAYHTAIYQTQIIHMPRPALRDPLGGGVSHFKAGSACDGYGIT